MATIEPDCSLPPYAKSKPGEPYQIDSAGIAELREACSYEEPPHECSLGLLEGTGGLLLIDRESKEMLRLSDVRAFRLILADPPYSVEDCEHYGTPMVNRSTVMKTLGAECLKGTHVVWLDQVLPMYKKTEWEIIALIGMCKSTNHRFRMVTIFRHK